MSGGAWDELRSLTFCPESREADRLLNSQHREILYCLNTLSTHDLFSNTRWQHSKCRLDILLNQTTGLTTSPSCCWTPSWQAFPVRLWLKEEQCSWVLGLTMASKSVTLSAPLVTLRFCVQQEPRPLKSGRLALFALVLTLFVHTDSLYREQTTGYWQGLRSGKYLRDHFSTKLFFFTFTGV